jgi:hypothetical protein
MKQIVAVLTLILVALIWLVETLLTPLGWYRLVITLLSQPFKRLRSYTLDLWIASDQHLNTIFFGTVDTTISARVGYYAAQGRIGYIMAEKIIDTLFWLAVRQKGHCRASIEPDEIH